MYIARVKIRRDGMVLFAYEIETQATSTASVAWYVLSTASVTPGDVIQVEDDMYRVVLTGGKKEIQTA